MDVEEVPEEPSQGFSGYSSDRALKTMKISPTCSFISPDKEVTERSGDVLSVHAVYSSTETGNFEKQVFPGTTCTLYLTTTEEDTSGDETGERPKREP